MILLSVIFLTFVGFGFISLIWTIIKGLINIGWWSGVNVYKYYKVEKPLKEKGFLEKKRMEKSMIEAEKQNKHKQQILNQQNRIVEAGLSKVRELRIRYPYAAEELFQLLLTKFPVMTVDEIANMEENIKRSHFENEVKEAIQPTPKKTYTLNDINGLEWLEEHREDPILLRIYKIDTDYLLYVKDIDKNAQQLFQSKDYLAMARVAIKVIDKQKEMKAAKQTIVAKDIEDLYNKVTGSTRSYRINNM